MVIRKGLALLLACFVGLVAVQLHAQDSEPEASAEVSTTADVDGAADEDASESHDGDTDHDAEAGGSHDGDEAADAHSAGGGHDDGHHDTDPTHGNMTDDGYSLVEFRADMALFSAVGFLLLLAGLITFAWKPIMEGLEKREQRIAAEKKQKEEDAAAAAAKLAEYEAKLSNAAEEARPSASSRMRSVRTHAGGFLPPVSR